ncbi:TetR/AcrR family transcriptional regulator [Mycolicibacterium confluentis]|uniref:TetR family transcriptional regulator n=1 Tax=Mycolicibacterium confluentis TaxID=28047 RepID=A0A7I7Y4I2_9MYCO|nr:TetR/AcrR family transcriptional regulator [Mycolicibacterium confluentis]MCV7318114.1 TetR/AcrR family transcriptional regulator [Mycolicibacterium confluentis]ORV31207.1 TetR family transcriptional regulator [Mycolicibacterium confluentis]BBZ36023.1 TetR family transcriptional regulator [Mycolicibacterium confluentis]
MTSVSDAPVPGVITSEADPFRARLFGGLVASINERDYRDTTVADIVRHAKTSKRTFYAHFASKDDCLLELLDDDNIRTIAAIRAAVDPEADWHTQIEQAIDAYVAAIEAHPAITLAWIREFPALGQAARPVQRRGMGRFIDLLIDITSGPGFRAAGLPTVSRQTALILLGGLRELTAHTMEDGEEIRGITEAAVHACTGLISR